MFRGASGCWCPVALICYSSLRVNRYLKRNFDVISVFNFKTENIWRYKILIVFFSSIGTAYIEILNLNASKAVTSTNHLSTVTVFIIKKD